MKVNSSYLILLLFGFLFSTINPSYAQKKGKTESKPNQQQLLESIQPSNDVRNRLELESLFIEAFNQKMLGNISEAIGIYQAIIKLDSKNHAAYYELNRIFFELGDLTKAEEYGEKAVVLNPKNEWYYIYLSETKAKKGDYLGAAATYKKLIDNIEDSYDYYFDWAYMLTNAGKLKEAVKVYDILEGKYGISETFSMEKEALYIRMGDTKSAAKEISKLISLDSANLKYYGLLGELHEANFEYDLALKAYEKLLSIDSTNQEGLLALADMYQKTGNDVMYQSIIQKVFAGDKLDLDTKIYLFIPYIEEAADDTTKLKEVLTLSDIIIRAHPEDPKPYTAKGDVYYNTGNTDLALEQYLLAVQKGSCPATVWYQVFQLLAEKEKYDEIIEYAEKSKGDIGEEVLPYFYKGVACQQKKEMQCAVEEYKLAIGVKNVNPPLKAQIFSNMGDAYNELKQYEKSDSAFEESLVIDPNNAYVLNNYSYYLSLRKDKLDRAKSMSKKSNLLVENNSSFQDTYAWILFQMEQYEEAKVWIEKAISNMQSEEKPVLLEHYGDILFKLGDVDTAVTKWQQALDAGGEKKMLEEKIKSRSFDVKQ